MKRHLCVVDSVRTCLPRTYQEQAKVVQMIIKLLQKEKLGILVRRILKYWIWNYHVIHNSIKFYNRDAFYSCYNYQSTMETTSLNTFSFLFMHYFFSHNLLYSCLSSSQYLCFYQLLTAVLCLAIKLEWWACGAVTRRFQCSILKKSSPVSWIVPRECSWRTFLKNVLCHDMFMRVYMWLFSLWVCLAMWSKERLCLQKVEFKKMYHSLEYSF